MDEIFVKLMTEKDRVDYWRGDLWEELNESLMSKFFIKLETYVKNDRIGDIPIEFLKTHLIKHYKGKKDHIIDIMLIQLCQNTKNTKYRKSLIQLSLTEELFIPYMYMKTMDYRLAKKYKQVLETLLNKYEGGTEDN